MGERVNGQWCSWITKKSWDRCVGCMGRWRLNSRCSALSKRAELTAFSCLVKKVFGLTNMHVDNKGSIHGLWTGEMKCVVPKAKDADLWIKNSRNWIHVPSKEMLIEVEHVKAHRTETETAHVAL